MPVEPNATSAIGAGHATLSGPAVVVRVRGGAEPDGTRKAAKIYDRLFVERSVLHDYLQ